MSVCPTCHGCSAKVGVLRVFVACMVCGFGQARSHLIQEWVSVRLCDAQAGGVPPWGQGEA